MTQTQITPEPFRWLFIAHFNDGSIIEQTPDDIKPDSNQFKPVLERQEDLVAFELKRVDSDEIVTVDLQTGAFIVNGTPFNAHEQNFEPTNHKLRLVYYRERREQASAVGAVEEDGSLSYSNIIPERSYINRYFIGWQTTVRGKNKQVTLAVG